MFLLLIPVACVGCFAIGYWLGWHESRNLQQAAKFTATLLPLIGMSKSPLGRVDKTTGLAIEKTTLRFESV